MKHALATLAILAATTATAETLDFESGYIGPETAITGTEFPGMTFTSPGGLRVVQTGTENAFWPDNNPVPSDALGSYFLASAFQPHSVRIGWTYDRPMSAVMFDLADVDGSEKFGIRAFDADGNQIGRRVVLGTEAGNQSVTRISFAGEISEIKLWGRRIAGHENNPHPIGHGIDNITSVAPVPLPATVWLLLAAIGFLWRTNL